MEIYCFLHILPYKQTVTFIRLRYLSSPVIIVWLLLWVFASTFFYPTSCAWC